jgi:hypothetical protein
MKNNLIYAEMVNVLWYSILVSSCIFVKTFLCSMVVVTLTRVRKTKEIVNFES